MADLFPRAPLASDDAEGDYGTHGNRSVPAMLRSIRELLSSHERAVTESQTPSVEEALSTDFTKHIFVICGSQGVSRHLWSQEADQKIGGCHVWQIVN